MKNKITKKNKTPYRDVVDTKRPHLSKATIKVAKRSLKEFESQTDEGFLTRAEMDRKLSSL